MAPRLPESFGHRKENFCLTGVAVVCKLFAIVPAALDVERIRALLVGRGHAWTRPRSAVLHALVSTPVPLKVEEIHERLSQWASGRDINPSSVYRTVHLLQALGVVRRVQFGDGAGRYELAEGFRDHHHHFICEGCGRIEDVPRCPLEGADLGGHVRSHHLELFGLCRECTREEGPQRVSV